MANTIPTQLENPKGLHQRYLIHKIVPASKEYIEQAEIIHETTIPENVINTKKFVPPLFMPINVDQGSEYFIMRLDEGGKDPEHIKACRIGVHAYAEAIKHHLPELSNDLINRYPLLP